MTKGSDEICDKLFQVRDSMDKQIRLLQDVKRVLNVVEAGFVYLHADNTDYEESMVRIMSEYLCLLEKDMCHDLKQISSIEGMSGGDKDRTAT